MSWCRQCGVLWGQILSECSSSIDPAQPWPSQGLLGGGFPGHESPPRALGLLTTMDRKIPGSLVTLCNENLPHPGSRFHSDTTLRG